MTDLLHKADCDCRGCFARNAPFSYLNSSDLDYLNAHKYVVNYRAGEMIAKQNSVMTHLLSFYTGLAKIYLEGLNGQNLILQLIKGGDFLVGPGMYTDYRHHYSISAICPSTVCFIDVHAFQDVLKQNQQFALHSQKAENLKKITALRRLVSLTQKQMPGRIADALLYLHDIVYGTNPFKMDLSRRDLADMTALSKESVIRVLKQFKDEEIIDIRGTRIEILNMEAVKHFSEVG